MQPNHGIKDSKESVPSQRTQPNKDCTREVEMGRTEAKEESYVADGKVSNRVTGE